MKKFLFVLTLLFTSYLQLRGSWFKGCSKGQRCTCDSCYFYNLDKGQFWEQTLEDVCMCCIKD